jgi:hypothetical protein
MAWLPVLRRPAHPAEPGRREDQLRATATGPGPAARGVGYRLRAATGLRPHLADPGGRVRCPPLWLPPNSEPSPEPEPGLEGQLHALEQQAEVALPGFDAQFYNRAGDLCVEAGSGPGAEPTTAAPSTPTSGPAATTRRRRLPKALRVSPGSVRARATLAWLSIGKGLLSDAQWEVDEYVEAAVAPAAPNWRANTSHDGRLDPSTELRALLADHLRQAR